jgi:hypothetical protein
MGQCSERIRITAIFNEFSIGKGMSFMRSAIDELKYKYLALISACNNRNFLDGTAEKDIV